MNGAILDQIWSGTIERKDPSEMSEIAQMLSSLLVAPVACFASDTVDVRRTPAAWVAAEEVFPGASLADILYEELDINLADDTIVYLESTAMRERDWVSGDAMNDAVCKVLAGLANTRGEQNALNPKIRNSLTRAGRRMAESALPSQAVIQ